MSWLYEPEDARHDLDESDFRARPNPKGNRPRTKNRPEHKNAKIGFVTGIDLGRYRILVDGRTVNATLAKELRKTPVAVGDYVALAGDTSETVGALARIVRIEPRTTLLRRSADDTDLVERVIVANATQMLIVVAAANPEPRARLIDRYLAAAYDAGLHPILCITKTDLANPEEFLANFDGLDLDVIKTSSDAPKLAELNAALKGEITVTVGHSGVGKSTLVNQLVPEAARATGRVNEVTGRGRHTSTSARAIALDDGWIIDTPGVRSFGLGHVNLANLLKSFTDLYAVIQECPRDCSHLADSPDCALDEAIESGALPASRVDSLRRLMISSKTSAD